MRCTCVGASGSCLFVVGVLVGRVSSGMLLGCGITCPVLPAGWLHCCVWLVCGVGVVVGLCIVDASIFWFVLCFVRYLSVFCVL